MCSSLLSSQSYTLHFSLYYSNYSRPGAYSPYNAATRRSISRSYSSQPTPFASNGSLPGGMELEEAAHLAKIPRTFGKGRFLQGFQEFVVRGYHDTGRVLRERQEKRIVDDRTGAGGDLRRS